MILLTQIERQYLKMASSGLTPENFTSLSDEARDDHTRNLDKVIYGLMEENPNAFTEEALADHKKKNRLVYKLGS
jgi:hypothetical protein